MNVLEKIVRANYAATEADVEQLAHSYLDAISQGQQAGGGYLRILIATAQSKLGTPKRRSKVDTQAHQVVLREIHARFYPAVLKGITTPDIVDDPTVEPEEARRRVLERNRRSTFARTAKSTLEAFMRAGGDVRMLDPQTITKSAVRQYAVNRAPQDGRSERARIVRAADRIEKALVALRASSPSEAAVLLEALLDRFEGLQQHEPEADRRHAESTTIVPRRDRVEQEPVVLHRSA